MIFGSVDVPMPTQPSNMASRINTKPQVRPVRNSPAKNTVAFTGPMAVNPFTSPAKLDVLPITKTDLPVTPMVKPALTFTPNFASVAPSTFIPNHTPTPSKPNFTPDFLSTPRTNTSTPVLNICITPADEKEREQMLSFVPSLHAVRGAKSAPASPFKATTDHKHRKSVRAHASPYPVVSRSSAWKDGFGSSSSSPSTPKSILRKQKSSSSPRSSTPIRFGLYNETIEIPDRHTVRAMTIQPPFDRPLVASSSESDKRDNDEDQVRSRLRQAAANSKSNSVSPIPPVPVIETPIPRRIITRGEAKSEPTRITVNPLVQARRNRLSAKREWDEMCQEEDEIFGPNACFAPDYNDKLKAYYAKRGITNYKLDGPMPTRTISAYDTPSKRPRTVSSGTYGLWDDDDDD